MIKPQPTDISNTPLQGTLNGIPYIQNVTTQSGEWTAITLTFEESKQLILQSRSQITWLYSTTSGGDYFTVRAGGAIEAPIVATSGTLICWVMPEQDTIFELLVGR
jgi:hypothetical protein